MFEIQSEIKNSNKLKIINLMAKKRILTKNNISKELKLSIPAVTSNIKELLDENILMEAGQLDSSEGRKPTLFEYNPNYRYSVGIELREDYIRMIITNMDSKIIEDYYKEIHPSEPEEIIGLLVKTLDSFFKLSSIDVAKIAGIGFSIHGYINDNSSIGVFYKSKLYTLSFDEVRNYFKVPIYLRNNIVCAALAEFGLDHTEKNNNSLYLYVNNGVGAGIMINNEIHQGHDRIAGAIGHMTINVNGKLCRCGNKGCWETYIKKVNLVEEFNTKSQDKITSIKDFFDKLDSKDSLALDIFGNYVANFEVGLRSIVLMFNPSRIVIGGFLVDYFTYLKKHLNKELFSKSTGIHLKKLNIQKSRLKDDASILGASLIPLQNILRK